jgi:hypothetical protein
VNFVASWIFHEVTCSITPCSFIEFPTMDSSVMTFSIRLTKQLSLSNAKFSYSYQYLSAYGSWSQHRLYCVGSFMCYPHPISRRKMKVRFQSMLPGYWKSIVFSLHIFISGNLKMKLSIEYWWTYTERESRSTRRETCPSANLFTTDFTWTSWEWTRGPVVRVRRLTATAVPRPF